MLGNFSFGDYFKEEAIKDAWEFVTNVLNLPIDKLWVTVHNDDDEAYDIWCKYISGDRIKRLGDKDNFWSMGDTGACGPSSEIFYDQGSEKFNSSEDYLGGDGDRFLEIWNLVFMQYERDSSGDLKPLPKPSIDTGMGLERVTSIKEGKSSNYDSNLFMPLINKISSIVEKEYIYESGASFRVIADHIRAVSFLLSQGVLFANEGRGYVLRRILRRAVRHGYLLGKKEPFIFELVDTLIDVMGGHYPDLVDKREFLKEQIKLEEERFFKTIAVGIDIFLDELKNSKDSFCGEVAFKLYDTYGFPLDLTEDMLKEHNIKVDIDKFNSLMDEQKNRGKEAWHGKSNDSEKVFKTLLDRFGVNEFIGYTKSDAKSKVLAILDEEFNELEELNSSKTAWIMFDKTPFYAESGGQIGDRGIIEDGTTIAQIVDTKKFFNINLSKVVVQSGVIILNEILDTVVVDRDEVSKHHSATHLLQAALKIVLGDTVSQAGSLNDDKRLRFDFTYPKALTSEQLDEVEDLVNSTIAHSIESEIEELPIDLAKQKGAIAMFGEKYGDIVRVVGFKDFSVEFCGGIHVSNTANIGSFYITKESGVSAGVRRIEAVCGLSAINYAKSLKSEIDSAKKELKNQDITIGINKLKDKIKTLQDEITTLNQKSQKVFDSEDINGVKLIIDRVDGGDIKQVIDSAKNENDKVAIMLFQVKGEKLIIAAGVKDANIKAGNWVKEVAPIVGGGGGGRPDFAQAGGKDISKIDEAIAFSKNYAKELLKA
jgi:alanyl-tRNA synthetase